MKHCCSFTVPIEFVVFVLAHLKQVGQFWFVKGPLVQRVEDRESRFITDVFGPKIPFCHYFLSVNYLTRLRLAQSPSPSPCLKFPTSLPGWRVGSTGCYKPCSPVRRIVFDGLPPVRSFPLNQFDNKSGNFRTFAFSLIYQCLNLWTHSTPVYPLAGYSRLTTLDW